MIMMKLSGVKPTNTANYDFRPVIADPATFLNGDDFHNQASIEDNGLATCLANGPGSSNIFGIYNQGIIPRIAFGSTNFEEGFDIGLRTNADSADWTLNEGVYLQALSQPLASEELESIPFDVAFTSASQSAVADDLTAVANSMEWRPDPALYLSVLTGQLIVQIEQISAFDTGNNEVLDEVTIEAAIHVAGWKSILSDGKKKRRHSKRRKSHGRKRRSKK